MLLTIYLLISGLFKTLYIHTVKGKIMALNQIG